MAAGLPVNPILGAPRGRSYFCGESHDGAWKLSRLAGLDGSDSIDVTSDEFEVLLFDDSRFSVGDYQMTGDPRVIAAPHAKSLRLTYVPKPAVMGLSPKKGENAELALMDYIDETRLTGSRNSWG